MKFVLLLSFCIAVQASVVCPPGSFRARPIKANRCVPCTPCKPGTYEQSRCSVLKNRVCASCDILDLENPDYRFNCWQKIDNTELRKNENKRAEEFDLPNDGQPLFGPQHIIDFENAMNRIEASDDSDDVENELLPASAENDDDDDDDEEEEDDDDEAKKIDSNVQIIVFEDYDEDDAFNKPFDDLLEKNEAKDISDEIAEDIEVIKLSIKIPENGEDVLLLDGEEPSSESDESDEDDDEELEGIVSTGLLRGGAPVVITYLAAISFAVLTGAMLGISCFLVYARIRAMRRTRRTYAELRCMTAEQLAAIERAAVKLQQQDAVNVYENKNFEP